MTAELEHATIDANGLRFHVVSAGPKEGRPVMLLHGFPEFWYGWRHQIPALAEAGCRVIVPDQRGYNLSEKPPRIADYRIAILADDVVALVDAMGYETVTLVGHDWGGAVAWQVAAAHAERLDRLAILNCPHPHVLQRHLRRNPRQMLRSWYFLYFQIPWLPEAGMRAGNWSSLCRALRKMSDADSFTDDELSHYQQAWSQPGAMRSMIHWYRAMLRCRAPQTMKDAPARISTPTLIIWGEQDTALGKELAPDSMALCEDARLERLPDAGHFVQHDARDQVNRFLVEFAVAFTKT